MVSLVMENDQRQTVKIFDKGIKNIVAGGNHTLLHKEDVDKHGL